MAGPTGDAESESKLLRTEDVLRAEVRAICNKEITATGVGLCQELNELNLKALCLSGGGIRSAAFALGVMQALATHPRPAHDKHVQDAGSSLLAEFHYLSTVSGGGYIGSWLSAWIKRTGFSEVWQNLVKRPLGPDVEPAPLAWLRAYSNYLTPQLGLTSADTWAGLALYGRNLLLNWLVILPVLCGVLLLLKLFAMWVAWCSQFDPHACGWAQIAAVAGCLLLGLALRFVIRNRPTRGASRADQYAFLVGCMAPALLASISFTLVLAFPCTEVFVRSLTSASLFKLGIGLGVVIYVVSWIAALPRWRGARDFLGDATAWLIAGAIYGALMALGAYLCIWGKPSSPELLLIVFGVPWALTAQLIAEMIFVGLTSSEKDSDDDREWLGRAAGWFLAAALAWLLTMLLVFVGSSYAEKLYHDLRAWLTTVGAGTITAWLGKSRFSSEKGTGKTGRALSANVVLAITATAFAILLIVLTSALLDHFLLGNSLILTASFRNEVSLAEYPPWPGGCSLWLALVATSALGAVASIFVNINRFSLHALYRNRLIRAFLGASNRDRKKTRNPFTDFTKEDNLRMHELASPNGSASRPFHIINIALNIVSSKRLAWQQRKAEPFIVSPLHSGSGCISRHREKDGEGTPGAYRPSGEYGGEEGISLGTAMAISGAAASPNMGYHSSPALALLMTLFNVRLGWWLGNPANHKKKIYGQDGPRFAIKALLTEMFGLTTDEAKYIYLSDGGHFENLGLYEMVRRRCRLIVVSDAGCDENFAFEDLGNALRKISLDLGVPIKMERLKELKTRQSEFFEGPYHAVGEIDYRTADGAPNNGYIFYVKPGYHGIEGVGVRAYATANPNFPHEPTSDQFFSESQFESYRALGFEIVDELFKRALFPKQPPESPVDRSLEGLIKATEKIKYGL